MARVIRLPGDGTASGVARRTVRDELTARGASDEEFIDDAVLVTSELVSNAVSHGTPPFELTVEIGPDAARVSVANHGATGEPRIQKADDESGRGRGLAMINHLADDWGWTRAGERIDVWAQLTAG